MTAETTNIAGTEKNQGLVADDFMYFFMRIRKCRCRQVVGQLKRRYPDASPEELAERLVASQTILSMAGGVLTRAPAILPGSGRTLRLTGIAGGTIMLSTMHLFLILKIALAFGRDIDDQARIPEMIAVVAATIPSIVMLRSNQVSTLATGGLMAAATAQLIGRAAIAHYRRNGTGK